MRKVLIVDDEDYFRGVLIDILTGENFETVGASNGVEAVEIFQKMSFDVVLLDLKMPSMDGIETMQQLKKINPCIPVIILTAFGDIPAAVEAVKNGADDFITKPPEFDKLVTVLKKSAGIYQMKKKDTPVLSARENEILKWLKEGKSSNDIGQILDITINTVNFHLKNIYKKLNVVNRTQAVSEALRMGIISGE